MTKGFDDYKNGLIFGAIFGALVAFVALMVNSPSWISWLGTGLTNISNWFVSQTWWPDNFWYTLVGTVKTAAVSLKYAIAILVGAIVGIYIDKK